MTKIISMKLRQWIEKDEFETSILKGSGPRIVLFAADWCGYCSRFLSIASQFRIKTGLLSPSSDEIYVVNIDSKDESLWDLFDVERVPTLVAFSNGKEIFRRDGKLGVGLIQTDLEDAIKAAASSEEN